MKKVVLAVLACALAAPVIPVVRAADDSENKFEFNGMVRSRYEYMNNYLDLADKINGVDSDDHLTVAPYRVDVGITGNFAKNVTAHVDLMYTGHWGDEWNPSWDFWTANFNGFSGPMSQADTAYQFATQGVQLYQGWVEMGKIGGSDVSLRIGRQEHTYGTELLIGDNDYYSGQSFDGIRAMWQKGHNDLNVFYYKIANADGFFFTNFGNSSQSTLWGATYDYDLTKWGKVGGNALISQDLGGFGPAFVANSGIDTYGAHWTNGMMNGDKLNMFDWNIEYDMQTGDLGGPGGPSTNLKAWIGEAWFAFNFNAGNGHGRVHIGTLMTSGDKASTADDEEFVDLYGDFHAHNRFGDLDWVDQFGQSNITDFNIGYEHWFGANHSVMISYHSFKETESNGAASDKIGDEIDLKYGYRYSKNLSFEAFIGEASPDDKLVGYPTDQVQRVSAQAKLTW